MLHTLTIDDFDQMYRLMEASFPQDEYRPYAGQKTLFHDPDYRVYAYFDHAHTLLAFLAVWDFEQFAFIEHFAVAPNCRNLGLGSLMLQEVASQIQKPLCLEAELPDTELAKRRLGFYQRNGFCVNPYAYMQPALADTQGPIPLCILTYPSAISELEFCRLRAALYPKVYGVIP